MSPIKQIAKPIGVCIVAKAYCANGSQASIRLFSESGCDEGAYFPAQDIHVYGIEQIKSLKEFCEETIKLFEETKKEMPF